MGNHRPSPSKISVKNIVSYCYVTGYIEKLRHSKAPVSPSKTQHPDISAPDILKLKS